MEPGNPSFADAASAKARLQGTGAASPLAELRRRIAAGRLCPETELLEDLRRQAALDDTLRERIGRRAQALVEAVREHDRPSLMEAFLTEYGLSTSEGIALMCLAEALLRVPDAETVDDLIADKITASDWSAHAGQASSPLVNASTWALMLTGRVLDDDREARVIGTLRGLVRRIGEPVVRSAVQRAMRELGRQFVLGETIESALQAGRDNVARGYRYSFDMLGEGARTEADARRYHLAYADAITAIADQADRGRAVHRNPGISVKLSALHPRFEAVQRDASFDTLVSRLRSLAVLAANAGLGPNIDAEEAERLEYTLEVFEAVAREPALAGWQGFGLVVQAYGRRALPVIDWLAALAAGLDRRFMVRLVKGAYWDTEIKHAQVLGIDDYPVFTRKAATDLSYLACARRLLAVRERLFPQFATHNAHTLTAVLALADACDAEPREFELQRLHGMGESLFDRVRGEQDLNCRIYAPVGVHRDLLAYLVRRLLENGANSSFVHQIVDADVPAAEVVRDPLAVLDEADWSPNPAIPAPPALFAPRRNSRGYDLQADDERAAIDRDRAPFHAHRWTATPLLAGSDDGSPPGTTRTVANPARPSDLVGTVTDASPAQLYAALDAARAGPDWSSVDADARASRLEAAADLYEAHAGELLALFTREAGKTLADGVAELREAVDFLRYYAAQARRCPGQPRGLFACISPWNFPLAIFTGQIAAALAAGNRVVAKPAEQATLTGWRGAQLLHEAGIPRSALQLLPGDGALGARLVGDPRLDGVCFTGGTDTAQSIHRSVATRLAPDAPLIAETGGINAMVVDSTALPEQAVRDIVASAFQSAGQRCSALRMLYLQEDVAERLLTMLTGAMDCLQLGDPWDPVTDVGPLIDAEAAAAVRGYVDGRVPYHQWRGRRRGADAADGHFVPPTLIRVGGIDDVPREIFGPVLHVATFAADELAQVLDAVNARGYGLTFGLHTRLDDRVQFVVDRMQVGNVYVNRNQIGAIVESQPFGGEGLSGTGPKAGGPHYLRRFQCPSRSAGPAPGSTDEPGGAVITAEALATAFAGLDPTAAQPPSARIARLRAAGADPALLDRVASLDWQLDLPGPTGERNHLRLVPRGRVLCLGPDVESARAQAVLALATGNAVLLAGPALEALRSWADGLLGLPVAVLAGRLPPSLLAGLNGLAAVLCQGSDARDLRRALAERSGPLVPLFTDTDEPLPLLMERHLCIDTTAAGGNAQLLAEQG